MNSRRGRVAWILFGLFLLACLIYESSTSGQLPGTVPSNPASGLENSPSITGQTFCNVCACN